MAPIRVIIADDHPVVAQGVADFLEKSGQFQIVATFRDGKAMLQSPLLSEADILLLDLNMPRTDGLQVLHQLQKMGLFLKTIIITSYHSPQLAIQCRESGADGYLVKSEDLFHLSEKIQAVLSGETVFPDFSPSHQKSGDHFSYFDEFLKKHRLTKREVEIIRLICRDYSSKDIAARLSLSIFTINTHRRNVVRKLGLDDSKLSLYKFALENGVV